MIVHPATQSLVLKLNDPARIKAVIPTARVFPYQGAELLAVPHRLDEVRVLRNLGIKAPSPIKYLYDWPRAPGMEPFRAQLETAEFLTLNPRAFVLSDMGTGKTNATLWAIDYLRRVGLIRKVLVISPLSTLERTWADEVFRLFPTYTVAVLHGDKERRLRRLDADADIYVINHHGVRVIEKELIARRDIDCVVIDEIAAFRNPRTELWKSMSRIIANRTWVWGLTGTPTPNAPTDAWGQCKLLTPERVPRHYVGFRDAVMKQTGPFKWIARPNANEIVAAAMQPAIRFKREDCVDLPECIYQTREVEMTPEQKQAYKEMMGHLAMEFEGQRVLAVNEAAKLQKLLQICCIREGTPVLTGRGWVAIEAVTAHDMVWDGVEWVRQRGAMFMGLKPVITCAGVQMTADHKVLSTSGWVSAQELNDADASRRLERAQVRLPDSARASGANSSRLRSLAMSVRLRRRSDPSEPVPALTAEASTPRVRQVRSWEHAPRDGAQPPLPNMDAHAPQVFGPEQPRLAQLRWSGDNCLHTMGSGLRSVLGGHGSDVLSAADVGSPGQQRPLLTGELSVGHSGPAGEQQAQQQAYSYAQRCDDGEASGSPLGHQADHVVQTAGTRLGGRESSGAAVYDIINCGPRHRFVVKGADDQLLIVHNCGQVYGPGGEEVALPCQPRENEVRDIIDQAGGKVIVFVPFRAALRRLVDALSPHYSVGLVDGQVSATRRGDIFTAFQKGSLQVLAAQPAAMSHGLTLTAANTIVWYGPVHSQETYTQANARITRPGQKQTQFIVHIEGSAVERKIYKRLKEKQAMEGVLLDLIREGL